ncbi:MAG: filamentous hemagglutinin N-terminal domain-containing protein [Gammaproteobacteria bacterium]|nr:filamentous hemagglutinin N-terminal domain-containing protein [Gammaproteobacteria bacterium]
MKRFVFSRLGGVMIFVLSAGSSAEVILDGSLGSSGPLSGPEYRIEARDGRQAEANLFHSFSRFNLNAEESAVFFGPDSVDNIISRVTGGEASSIDGLLASFIPDVNLYFLNPAGVMLGPNAALNIGGSFHVSSADYLRLGEDERFYSLPAAGENLSVAAPAAFGFLDGDIAPLSFSGKGEIAEAEWDNHLSGLYVADGKTLSLIGGNIEIGNGAHFHEEQNGDTVKLGSLSALDGQINLAAAASEGEAVLTETGVDTSGLAKRGDITIAENSRINASGEGGGRVAIRAGRFVLTDSDILAVTYGAGAGGEIDIQAKDALLSAGASLRGDTTGTGSGSDIRIQASGTVSLTDSDILAATFSSGAGGAIDIQAKDTLLSAGASLRGDTTDTGTGSDIRIQASGTVSLADSDIFAVTYGAGTGGAINIQAKDVLLSAGASLRGDTTGTGTGSDIRIQASGTVSLAGENEENAATFAAAQAFAGGDAGNIAVEAENISFKDGAYIILNTYDSGKGGDVNLAGPSVLFAGEDAKGRSSRLESVVREGAGGDGGSVSIQAENIIFRDGAQIITETLGAGKGGEVSIEGTSLVSFLGENSSGQISGIYGSTFSPSDDAGDGGAIEIIAGNIEFAGSAVESDTSGAGKGGSITLRAGETIRVGGISSIKGFSSYVSASTIEKEGSSGDAGNIQIETKDLQISDGGEIVTTAFAPGQGGNIRIKTQDTVSIDGAGADGWASGISARSNPKFIETPEGDIPGSGGPGGDIDIEAQRIILTNGGVIGSSSIAPPGLQSSDAGRIDLRAETIEISGVNPYGETEDALGSGLYAHTRGTGDNAGKGGEIQVQTKRLTLIDGGMMSSNTDNRASGGNIRLAINDTMEIRGDSSGTVFKEPAEAQQEFRTQFGDSRPAVSGIYTNSTSTENGAGAAGDITFTSAGRIHVFITGGAIATKTINAGGGKVTLENAGLLYLRDGEMTTSVKGGFGNGGDISVNSGFIVQSGSPVIAQAFGGKGGNITINTTGVYRFPPQSASPIDASSRKGINGIVQIHSPDVDISAGLVTLPADYLDAEKWAQQSCSAEFSANASSFVVKQPLGMSVPATRNNWLPPAIPGMLKKAFK